MSAADTITTETAKNRRNNVFRNKQTTNKKAASII